jgi:ParB-like chromosome segregation protein Spo0J
MMEVYKITDIIPNDLNWNIMTEEEYETLKNQIKADSKEQLVIGDKLILRPVGSKYELVDGHWRYKAIKELGFDEIPGDLIEIREYDEAHALLFMFHKKLRGSQNDPFREAQALKRLKDAQIPMRKLTELTGKSERRIYEILNRLEVSEEIKEKVRHAAVSPSMLDEINKADTDEVKGLLVNAVINEGFTRRDVRRAITERKRRYYDTAKPIPKKIVNDIISSKKMYEEDKSTNAELKYKNIKVSNEDYKKLLQLKNLVYPGRSIEEIVKIMIANEMKKSPLMKAKTLL